MFPNELTNAHELLIDAKARIQDPAHWTQEYLARDERGFVVSHYEPTACKWCAMGSLFLSAATVPTHVYQDADRALDDAAEALYPGVPYPVVNDRLGHEAIMAVYDRAIQLTAE